MLLNELIEQQTIESIAKKTNLSAEIIVKLFKKEFKSLKKPQALGALSIIEREYEANLEPLRQECKAYFADHNLSDSGLVGLRPIKKEKRIISKFSTLVLLIALSYGAWYFFTEYYKQKINLLDPQNETTLEESTLIVQDTVLKEKETPTAPEVQSIVQNEVPVDISEDNTSMASADPLTAKEENQTIQSTEALPLSTVVEEQNKTVKAVLETNQTLESNESNLSLQSAPAIIVRERITLLPQKTMWFRLINLETKKRSAFKRRNKFEIDLKEHAWLFATENAAFTLIDNDVFEEFSTAGKLFFRFDQEGMHPLTQEEYRALEK